MPKDTFLNLPQEKQQKIFKESINEFSNKGYEKGNIGEIAKRAGVAKGSMYQYFEDKKELFIYCINKAFELSSKYYDYTGYDLEEMSIFDYIYLGYKKAWPMMKEDKELFIFLQQAASGNNYAIKDEALEVIVKASRDYMYKVIEKNKEKGFIRSDISTEIIMLYLEGVSYKFKEKMMLTAKSEGKEIFDMNFEKFDNSIKDMITLLKSGMGRCQEHDK